MLEYFVEPLEIPQRFHDGGADAIVKFDKQSSVPRRGELNVPKPSQHPNLGAIVRAVNTSCDIAALLFGIGGLFGCGGNGVLALVEMMRSGYGQ